ncbi:TetR/AcrR family transcriptional regulator [Rhizobium laguerreae]|uniref:TetR/AcrR family transcriptional regulator n=1 Tax=Rhizobium laguerreae TaxID=1076926 RepID=UPI0014415BC1|nr:TetR/AcrR family transcriptional regulator [Rhizobium laguerreae]MBY3321489.1 TetR/AcrR family transcriptional regulator [Rhizobium laguerreae]MBY3362797.1 TetR/AcrR family transcriptional regulator [Rhizobium laguerreae]NKM67624.1 TetR family transcriptional regulator [Rhizobium laguerreae]
MTNLTSTSDEILASARVLIMNGGYNGFSYADIAETVGIRKASIHHHFPSKVDLVRTLVKRYREDAEAGFNGLEQRVSDPLELLKVYAGHWAQCIEDASRPFCVCALLASELPALPADVASEVQGFFRFLSKWIVSVMDRGLRDGSLKLSSAPKIEGEAFLAKIHGAMLSARVYGSPEVFAMVLNAEIERLSPVHA